MSNGQRFLARCRAFFAFEQAERELARETAAHLTLLEDDFVARGLTPDAARLAARRAIGGMDRLKEAHRDERSFPWLEDLRHDLRFGVRALRASPEFAAATILTLALGVGAATAVFTVVRGVLVRPLPYDPDGRIVRLVAHLPATSSPARGPTRAQVAVSAAEAEEIAARSSTLSYVGVANLVLRGIVGREDGARLQAARVSASSLPMLGAVPMAGRLLQREDERTGAPAAMLISARLWRRLFLADPEIVGRAVTLHNVLGDRSEVSTLVVGVVPDGFAFPSETVDVWLPFVEAPASAPPARGTLLRRLRPGATLRAAAAELGPIVKELRRHPAETRYELAREQDELVALVRPALMALTGAVALLLLLACANVAHLVLARSVARTREFDMRRALGAKRGRLARQTLAETTLLATLALGPALLVAYIGVRAFLAMGATVPRIDLGVDLAFPRLTEIGFDPTVLFFAFAIAVASGAACGLIPALKVSAGSSRPQSTARIGKILLTVEAGLSLVLLVGAGLLVRSMINRLSVQPGYEPQGVLTFQVNLPRTRYSDPMLVPFAEQLTAALRQVPGVRSAAYANQLPMVQIRDSAGGLWKTPDTKRGPVPDAPDARFVSRDYLRTLEVATLHGRSFGDEDDGSHQRVVVINQSLAAREFSGQNPLGEQAYIGRDPEPWQIVGIVSDMRQFGLDRAPEPQFFIDLRQYRANSLLPAMFPVGMYFALRTAGADASLVPSIRRVLASLDAEAVLFNVAPLEDLLDATLVRPRLYATSLAVFAGTGLLVALVGLYGLMSYTVAQRTKEIGIRRALGEPAHQVIALTMWQGLLPASLGIGLGALASVAATKGLEAFLYGVEPFDPATFLAVSVIFIGTATIAAFIPARRASQLDPLVALRHD